MMADALASESGRSSSDLLRDAGKSCNDCYAKPGKLLTMLVRWRCDRRLDGRDKDLTI
jgi:hypothetical protein